MFPKPPRRKKRSRKNSEVRKAVKSAPCVIKSPYCVGPVDPCHIKSFGSGGVDEDWNLMSLCRFHHSLQHTLGIMTFLNRYPLAWECLKEKGWDVIEGIGRSVLWHPNLANGEVSG